MSDYILMPFNFKQVNKDRLLLVNQAGEYYIMPRIDFDDFCNLKLQVNSEYYKRLKAKHFLTTDKEKDLVIEMLATKLRTRKEFIIDFTSLHMIVITLRCNCLCKYCHASSVDLSTCNYDMTW